MPNRLSLKCHQVENAEIRGSYKMPSRLSERFTNLNYFRTTMCHVDTRREKTGDEMIRRLWPGLGRDTWLNTVIASPLLPKPLRWRILRLLGMRVERSNISPRVWFGSTRVAIGEGTFINYECFFNTSAPVEIGRRCDVAMGVMFVTSSHELGPENRRAGQPTADAIVVGDGTWIGARSTILPGVTIGPGAVIAAGSVVVSDCEPNTLYAGVPARAVRKLVEAFDR